MAMVESKTTGTPAVLAAVRIGLASGSNVNGRGERIRTSDLLNPIQVRYRTALRPDENNASTHPSHLQETARRRSNAKGMSEKA